MKKQIYLLLIIMSLFVLSGCQVKTSMPALPSLKIGIVSVQQPMSDLELMAGYIPEPRVLATNEEQQEIMKQLATELAQTQRSYTLLPEYNKAEIEELVDESTTKGALAYWIAYGKKAEVELIIVPQVLYYNDKNSDKAQVNTSALMLDFFLIDIRDEGILLKRTHFAEQEQPLAGNMLGMSSFIKRVGKTTMPDMLHSAIQTMVIEFGL